MLLKRAVTRAHDVGAVIICLVDALHGSAHGDATKPHFDLATCAKTYLRRHRRL